MTAPTERWRVHLNTVTGRYHVRRGDELLKGRNGWARSFGTSARARDAANKENAKSEGGTS